MLLVEDSIVRCTTMKVLLNRIRRQGEPKEIHVRVACPPIVSPCFYGIDMSTIGELFAPQYLQRRPVDRGNPGPHGRRAAGRQPPLPAGRVDRPGDRARLRPALPGVHHGQVSHRLRPAAGRAGPREPPPTASPAGPTSRASRQLARISHQVARPRSFRRRDCVATGQAGSAAVLREGQFGRRRGKSGEEPDVGSVFPAFSRVLRGVSPPECRHNRDVPPT